MSGSVKLLINHSRHEGVDLLVMVNGLDGSGILYEFEIRDSALEDLNGRVYFLSNGLQDDHISEESSELPVEFHVVVADYVEHSHHKFDAFDIEDAFAFQY
jgi:hypothetical protein